MSLASAAVLLASMFIYAASAGAVPPQAGLNYDYYVQSYNATTAYNWGCGQGKTDNLHGASSMIILDFGQQSSTGTTAPLTNNPLTFAQVESTAEQFAKGYFGCSNSTSTVSMAIGTNNYGSSPSTANGRAWANEVNRVANWISINHVGQVVTEGANDIESWGSQAATLNWLSGYTAVTSRFYINFGSLDSCPDGMSPGVGSPCNAAANSWNQYGYWYLSYGAPRATVTPEIYLENDENKWGWLSEYAYKYQSGPMYFQGPLDGYARDKSTLTPAKAWSDLWTALQSLPGISQATFPYADEQH